jgi:tetratricopeptide (TPR) repeat protein
MRLVPFAKTQFEVARCIGREDYDGAIRALEGSLSNTSEDAPSLAMIAMCHRWSNRNDEALTVAQRILVFDPTNFDAFQLLSEIHAERQEHEAAARFIRLGLDHFPEPTPPAPKFLFRLLRIGALVSRRLRHVEETARSDLGDPDRDNRKWYLWATKYLAWYASHFDAKQSPTIH